MWFFFWRFWPKNWNSWSHDIETFHTEKSGVLEEKPRKRKILRRQLFMLKLATIRSDQSQSSTPGQSPDGSPVLKYFLYETIHNGNRGTHFTKFLISNFLRGLTYSIYTTILILTMNIINILVAISSFTPCFLHNQDKKEHYNFFLQILSHCNGALLTALQYGGPPSLTSLIQQQVRIQNWKDQILSMFHPKSYMVHGTVFNKRSSKLIHKIDSDHIVRCYCVCCPHLRVKWKKSRFETSLRRKQLDLV